jgi:predicted aldo/keto reductase-like oxidoreductase
MSGDWQLPRRRLGRTGLETSVLGLGGFHQVEITQDIVSAVMERFLEAGGNYVETAVGYGKGAAESKIGTALRGHRNRAILVSKTAARTAEDAHRELDGSLRRLQTDYLDILIFHCISDVQTLDVISGSGGAAEAFLAAQDQGLIRHIAVSTHWPKILPEAINRLPVEAIMVWVSYLARCNYPEIEREVIPAARRKGLGVIGMKPVGDGYLYRSVRDAFTYALSRDVDVLACGFNSLELLEADLQAVRGYSQCDERQIQDILRNAPELGDYVCRQCECCEVCQAGVNIRLIFELEGKFDQQMADGRPHDAADYALRERLKYWFGNQENAKKAYADLAAKADACLEADHRHVCPYGIDMARKLRLAHQKLTGQYMV